MSQAGGLRRSLVLLAVVAVVAVGGGIAVLLVDAGEGGGKGAAGGHGRRHGQGGMIAFVRAGPGTVQIAHGTYVERDPDLFVIRPDGSGLANLTRNGMEGRELPPAWSPDGHRIAFVREGGIYTVDLRTQEVTQIVPPPEGNAPWFVSVTWAPDGTRLAADAYPAKGNAPTSVFLVRLDGAGLVRIVGQSRSPAWAGGSPSATRRAGYRSCALTARAVGN
ncbi:MAG: hypothetical protein KatS3mg014_1408 [Actinomycetota bacterium]|nr:MAG: hypothetical protein KatS3mg014_1408 [Actinomycetota bacterium]